MPRRNIVVNVDQEVHGTTTLEELFQMIQQALGPKYPEMDSAITIQDPTGHTIGIYSIRALELAIVN